MKYRIAALFTLLAFPALAQTPTQFSGTQTGPNPSISAAPLTASGLNAAFGNKLDATSPTANGPLTLKSNGATVVHTDASGNGYFTGNVYVNATGATVAPSAVFTVATLPTCSTTNEGAHAAVSDSTVVTFLGALAGGGTNHVPVYCTGSGGWKVG